MAGQLLARRLPGTAWSWVASLAAAGALIGIAYCIAAISAHGLRLTELVATGIGAVAIALQVLALQGTLPAGPFDTVGSLAIWPLRVRPIDLAAVVVLVGAFLAALPLTERFSLEALLRRTALVAQLRFAVTMQDLRTVMLLRRQLSLEACREEPWFSLGRSRGPNIWKRSMRCLLRFPARRLIRMVGLSVAAGLAAVAEYRGWGAMFVVAGLATFLVGLEAVEPLAQEIDHPDLTESFPIEPGRLHQRLLLPSALLLALLAVPATLAAFALEPAPSTLLVGLILGIPAFLVGGAGATLNAIGGAPNPSDTQAEGAFLPPEVAGMHLVFRMVRPPLIACLGTLPVLLVARAVDRGDDGIAMAVRGGIAVLLLAGAVFWWVERRVAFFTWWRSTMSEAKQSREQRGIS
ncbi:MAG: hypothetical protein R2705_23890 [Ilumatobacteraceae bacterium]